MVRKAYGPGSSSSGRRPVADRRRVDPWAAYPAVRPRSSAPSSGRVPGRSPVGPVGLPRQSGWLTAKRHAGAVQSAAAPVPTTAPSDQTMGQPGYPGQVWPQPAGPTLPVFSPAAAAAAGAVPAGQGAPAPAAVVRRPGQGLEEAAAWGWRHRWPLTPVAAVAVVVAGSAGAPGSTGAVLAGAAAGMAWWARSAREVRIGRGPARMWLSVRERSLAAGWMGAASVLAGAAALGVPASAVAALTVAGTAPAGVVWARSRRVRPTDAGDVAAVGPVLSERAAAIVAAWPSTIGLDGPDKLLGSHVVEDTMSEPAPGTFAFAVELASHVHARDAVGETVTRALERTMRMPLDTVEVRADRDDAARILVTLQPDRDLEHAPAPWPPPGVVPGELLDLERGCFSLAVERTGRDVLSHVWNEDGVEHALVAGASGAGKSVSTTALLLPGPLARVEVVVYVDGGGGTSNGALIGACDWVATEHEEWVEAVRAVWRILKARKASRAKMGLSRWRGRREQIPVVTLALEEAATLLGAIGRERSASGIAKRTLVDDVLEILREGRKLGVRVVQITQDPMGEDCWGARKGRGLIAGAGMVIAHRPNDAVAARMASNGKAATPEFNIAALPPVGGFAGIIRRGAVITPCARVRFADEPLVYAALDGFVPRQLEGLDAAAAGPAYTARTRGHVVAAQIAANRAADDAGATAVVDVDELGALLAFPELTSSSTQAGPEQGSGDVVTLNTTAAAAAAEAETNRVAVLTAITTHGPITRAELVEATGLSRATVGRALTHWATAGHITKTGDAWTLTDPAAAGTGQ